MYTPKVEQLCPLKNQVRSFPFWGSVKVTFHRGEVVNFGGVVRDSSHDLFGMVSENVTRTQWRSDK